MAEGLLRHLAGDCFDAVSAGTHPVGINPGAVEAMKEIGLNISAQRSKHLSKTSKNQFDYVITVCDRAKEACPVFPSTGAMLHWSFDDPVAVHEAGEARQRVFRRVRDEIEERIQQFLTGLIT
jgi:arsenate reductase